MTRGQCVAASATAIDALGPQTYLEHLVAVLTEEGTTGVGGILSPAAAITVAPVLCEPHPPLIDRTEWVAANSRLMDELGPRRYLALLLDVLAGNYV